MSRYYKKRRYSKQSDELGALMGMLVLVAAAYLYTHTRSFTEQYRYGLVVVIAVAAVILSVVIGILVYLALRSKHMYDAITIAAIDSMDGLEFERYLADLLRKRGYTNIRLTEKFDLGIDIVAQKNGITWGIQAKRYNSPVKAEAVRQAYTALNRYECDRAMVITNSIYSHQAQALARDNQIPLIDRQTLSKWIYEVSRADAVSQ